MAITLQMVEAALESYNQAIQQGSISELMKLYTSDVRVIGTGFKFEGWMSAFKYFTQNPLRPIHWNRDRIYIEQAGDDAALVDIETTASGVVEKDYVGTLLYRTGSGLQVARSNMQYWGDPYVLIREGIDFIVIEQRLNKEHLVPPGLPRERKTAQQTDRADHVENEPLLSGGLTTLEGAVEYFRGQGFFLVAGKINDVPIEPTGRWTEPCVEFTFSRKPHAEAMENRRALSAFTRIYGSFWNAHVYVNRGTMPHIRIVLDGRTSPHKMRARHQGPQIRIEPKHLLYSKGNMLSLRSL